MPSQTALSSTRNLYFVACRAAFYVYQPVFPSQALPRPSLIVHSRPTASHLQGQLDARQPHAINNLSVTQLGSDEVIAAVRDDGDVDVFLVRHIAHAIERRAAVDDTMDVTADNIRPVFQRNVGASCWGLAVHSQARMLAVSSNRHELTVFRFGLWDEVDDMDDNRSLDAEECVVNGEANIPCIAFCNTGDDPEARYILTTDINGICRTIDLRRMAFTQSFRFGRQIESVYGGGYDRINAGWMVLFLDRRSFMTENTLNDALGLQENDTLPDAISNPHIWDLSRTTKILPDISNTFLERHAKSVPPTRLTQLSLHRASSATDIEMDEAAYDSETELFEESLVTESRFADSQDDVSSIDSASAMIVDDDDDDLDGEGTEDTTPSNAFYGGERICGNHPRFAKLVPFCDRLPCPILHASVRNLYMLQPTTQAGDIPHRPPFVGFAAPLKQSVQAVYRGLNMFERLNLAVYMPELGAVAIASQKGRVLVLALTKLNRSVKYPKEFERLGSRTNYALRVEAILPTIAQEKENLRPFAPLHGIAAAPMQGDEAVSSLRKRWRLLLMYQDHTVLSYELARKAEGGPQSLQQLVV